MPPAQRDAFDLGALSVHLQPIVSLGDGGVVGHEALVRGPAGCAWERPAAIAERAKAQGAERELEETCRRLALTAAEERLPADQHLFLNVDLRFTDEPPDAGFSVPPSRIAIEVSERQSILDNPEALAVVQSWRRRGCRLVLDDYGTGHASLGSLLAMQPDMIKVDRYIIAGIDHDARRRSALRRVLDLGRDLGVDVLAEGIETKAELRTLLDEGVCLGQGFLIGRPAPDAVRHVPAACAEASTPTSPSRPRGLEAQAGAFFGALLDAVPHGAYCVDRTRRVVRWNARAAEITGIPSTRVEGRTCMTSGLDHTSLDGLPLCASACPLVRTMTDGQPREETLWMRTRDGFAPARVSTSAVRNAEGTIVGAIEVFDLVDEAAVAARAPHRLVRGPSEAVTA